MARIGYLLRRGLSPPILRQLAWRTIILSVLLTFRTFPAVLSRIAAFNTPGAPLRAPQFFRTGTGHRVKARPLAAPITPPISSMRDSLFVASSVRSRYGPPACSPPGLTRPLRPFGRPSLPGLLLPGFQVTGSPRAPAGYHYSAKLRIAPAGLSPASTAASLAAPPWWLSTMHSQIFQTHPSTSPIEPGACPECPPPSTSTFGKSG